MNKLKNKIIILGLFVYASLCFAASKGVNCDTPSCKVKIVTKDSGGTDVTNLSWSSDLLETGNQTTNTTIRHNIPSSIAETRISRTSGLAISSTNNYDIGALAFGFLDLEVFCDNANVVGTARGLYGRWKIASDTADLGVYDSFTSGSNGSLAVAVSGANIRLSITVGGTYSITDCFIIAKRYRSALLNF